jgi:hypothetical protein
MKKEIFETTKNKFISEIPLKHIILDCSCMNAIDNMGVDAIIQVIFIFDLL